MKKKAILSVTNDLSSEQRVHKVCLFLMKLGLEVLLVGRLKRRCLPLEKRPYKTKRFFLLFQKGPFFYAEYNFRLFLYLLFHRADILVANDLDTLLANYLVSKIKGSVLVHDSHEYFTGVPELKGRNFAFNIWKKIERWIFPKLKYLYTVNDSIAKLYRDEYGVEAKVVRNFPVWRGENDGKTFLKKRQELGLPENKKIILYQGSINVDRGLLEAVEAMQYVNVDALLLIIGDGDILPLVKSTAKKLSMEKRIWFMDRMPFEKLRSYTACADLGISLDKDTNLNYRYSLPNKIFDYIHAGVPVLASNLTEIKKIFASYDIGKIIENHSPQHIAEKINFMLNSPEKIVRWKENCLAASKEFCWQNEEKILMEIYCGIIF